MNTDRDSHGEAILLTDAELDAVVGGAVALQDFHFVKHLDKASPQL
jgi:type VI protein secretion system component Hcp